MSDRFTATGRRTRPRFVLRPLELRGTIQGLLLQQRFPVQDRAAYAAALGLLPRLIQPRLPELRHVAFAQLGEAGKQGAELIRELGPLLDDFGLGIHPEAEAPRTWTKADFEGSTLNDRLPPLFHEIMRASPRRAGAAATVAERFLGTGWLAAAYGPESLDFYSEATRLFKPRITNRTARMFPYHAPLLRRRAAELSTADELQQWMCGARLYLREATEEEGVLLFFAGDAAEVLESALRTNEMPDAAVEFLV